jgi:predicted nucleic acid-binding protein
MPQKLRVFVDTSALLAGLNSPHGAAGTILAACFSRDLIAVISPQVIEETECNVPLKFPLLADAWANFLLIPPEITSEPTLREIKKVYQIIPTDDAPILASALKAKPDAFVIWNTKDFLRKEVIAAVPFPILIPQQFLERFL